MRAWLLIVLMLLSGCGYSTGSLLPSSYRSINIDHFKNKINYVSEGRRGLYIPLLENKVRDSVMARFNNDGHLRVSRSEGSDLFLTGDLIGFEREELRIDDNRNIQEYRVRITVNITLTDPSSGEVIWQEPSFSGEATYFLTGPQSKSEDAALEDALTDLSRRIVERTLENW